MRRESDLYRPVKALLEGQGYEVKGEVGAADMVAVPARAKESDAVEPIIIELKTGFSLSLFHQAINLIRIAVFTHDCGLVYLAKIPDQVQLLLYCGIGGQVT